MSKRIHKPYVKIMGTPLWVTTCSHLCHPRLPITGVGRSMLNSLSQLLVWGREYTNVMNHTKSVKSREITE